MDIGGVNWIKHLKSDEKWCASMKKLFAISMFLFAAACSEQPVPPSASPETLVSVTGGDVVGFVAENGAHAWRGIQYAADTSGENRWRAPRPVQKWEGVKEAIDFASVCPQIATPFTPIESFENGRLEGSEDCLALDVYAPPSAAEKSLPVMFWIHGGSNVSGASQLYVGNNLAVNENVVVVSVQYRLGPLGWFSHPALRDSAETYEDGAANFGILDLVAALKWVHTNIAVFGGNAENLTIFGESAGGHNVAALLASPLAKGLFNQAIIQSGSFASVSVAHAEGESGNEFNASLEVAERLGGPEKFHTSTLQEVFAAFERTEGGFMSLPRVIEDGVSLPAGPMIDAFASPNTFNSVPIISGTNRDESKLFFLGNERLTERKLGYFYVAKDQDLYDAAAEYNSRIWRLKAVDQPLARMLKGGHEEVYAYRFDWDEGGSFLWTDLSKVLGAAHAVEVPFVFNRFKLLGGADSIMFEDNTEESRQKLSRAMGKYWASFARTGRPAAPAQAEWRPYGERATLMHFDSENDADIRTMDGEETLTKIVTDLESDTRVTPDERCEIAGSWSGLETAAKTGALLKLECGQ